MASKAISLVVDSDGTTRHLVDPVSERFGTRIGPKISTRRASHVESWADLSDEARAWFSEYRKWWMTTDPNYFWVDLLPVDGPVLGPFAVYAQAIAAEIKWLQDHNLPTPTHVHDRDSGDVVCGSAQTPANTQSLDQCGLHQACDPGRD